MEDLEPKEEPKIKSKPRQMSTPNAVILAGLLIAGAIFFTNKGNMVRPVAVNNKLPTGGSPLNLFSDQTALNKMRPVSSNEHVRGNINAKVVIVEYSDLECPFCKTFHQTMKRLIDEYGSEKLAWVYRQFPLAGLHSKAEKEAEASECANELGGNEAFWKYIDRVYEITTSNNTLDEASLPEIAQYIGLNVENFNSCLSSGKYKQKIADDIKNATDTGARGTPWSIVVLKNGQKFEVEGSEPYETLRQKIDSALGN